MSGTDENLRRAQEAMLEFNRELSRRGGAGRPAIWLDLTQEFCSAALQGVASQQDDIELREVDFRFEHECARISATVKVRGRAWPPRPPVETGMSLTLSEIRHTEQGASGGVVCRVAEPLTFSNFLAEALVGLLGGYMQGMPVSMEQLRTRGSLLTIDFAEIVRAARPELAAGASLVRLHGLRMQPGKASFMIGFRGA
jgi:hypothetical protein